MIRQRVRLEAIKGAEYIVSEETVVFMPADDDAPSIELPLHVLPRLIGLSLNLAGRISQVDEDFSASLYLDTWTVTVSNDGSVLMAVELPGGAPLTFTLPIASANKLGLMLISARKDGELQ